MKDVPLLPVRNAFRVGQHPHTHHSTAFDITSQSSHVLLSNYSVHDQHSSSLDLYLAAISDKMHRTVTNHAVMFKTLR